MLVFYINHFLLHSTVVILVFVENIFSEVEVTQIKNNELFRNKIFTIFTILFVLLATFVTSIPIEKRAKKVIHVTSPGKGPWALKSDQVVSWWCNECKSDEDVIVRIIQKKSSSSNVEVYKKDGKNAFDGHLQFTIGKDWDVKKKYFAEVTLKSDSKVVGKGVEFGIFKP
ncbi:unnamed protein product [Rhizophagus irregularis]|uniref:Uncharacterized protein n=1 Tax=Rhizophagus irregularis TaxID=588596 RepID=A0A915ZAL2_9GLOM|nr:unnamed protein product [Rhizophagus irregularis]CAB5366980.1 unnamed protein product [Rhizophagus irregularis]